MGGSLAGGGGGGGGLVDAAHVGVRNPGSGSESESLIGDGGSTVISMSYTAGLGCHRCDMGSGTQVKIVGKRGTDAVCCVLSLSFC